LVVNDASVEDDEVAGDIISTVGFLSVFSPQASVIFHPCFRGHSFLVVAIRHAACGAL